jgi:hypothetical protein
MFGRTKCQPFLENGPDLGFHGPPVPRSLDAQPRMRHRIKPSDRKRRHSASKCPIDCNASNAANALATLWTSGCAHAVRLPISLDEAQLLRDRDEVLKLVQFHNH